MPLPACRLAGTPPTPLWRDGARSGQKKAFGVMGKEGSKEIIVYFGVEGYASAWQFVLKEDRERGMKEVSNDSFIATLTGPEVPISPRR